MKSGVHYSKQSPGRPLPDSLPLIGRSLNPAELSKITARVQAGISDKQAGHSQGIPRALDAGHARQAHRRRSAGLDRIGSSGSSPRNGPAAGPRTSISCGWTTAARSCTSSKQRSATTRCSFCKGLDYWIWAQANAEAARRPLQGPRDTHGRVVDYVVGAKDGKQDLAAGKQAVLSPYAPAQLEALDNEIDWQVHLCTGWATSAPS